MQPSDPATAEALRSHLLRYRGGWDKKLPADLAEALSQLPGETLRERAAYLLHGPRQCSEGRDRPIKRLSEGWQFCDTSSACPCFMRHFHATSEATNLARRGVRNAAQSDTVKAKMRDTCMQRYGVPTTGHLAERQEKAAQTNVARYGTENVFASETIKDKIRATTRERYGVDHISLDPEHRKRMGDAVREKWGVDNVGMSPLVRQKITQTNHARYGGPAPSASVEVRRKMIASTQARIDGHPANRHIAPEMRFKGEDDFRERCTGRRANDIARETGYHPSMIHRYAAAYDVDLDYTVENGFRAAECGFGTLLQEMGVAFRRNIRALAVGQDRRQHLEIDFLFDDHRLGVEFSGAYWHSEANGRDRHYHARKREIAAAHGISLLQVFEDEFIDHPQAVLATIRHRLGLTQARVFARKCMLRETDHSTATSFYDTNHVYGGVSASVHYGLFSADTMVACMSFTARSPEYWELVRYASNRSVVGGASRLLAAFEARHEWSEIVSFADLRWSDGALYRTLGFAEDGTIRPDYAYVLGDRRIHKSNLRKSSKRFAKYIGQGLTEREMAELEGIPRVYDAGKIRFVKAR